MKDYIRHCLNNGQEPQKYFTTTCLNSEMGNCTSEKRASPPMTRDGKLSWVKKIKKILGDEGLRDLYFNVSKGVTAKQASTLNKVQEEIPPASHVDKVGNIELQEIAKSMEDLIFQIKDVQTDTDDLFEHPLQELICDVIFSETSLAFPKT